MIPLRLFLFDLDGTLVSTGGAGLRALDRAFNELFGIENARHNVNPSGKTDPAIFREILQSAFSRNPSSSEIETIATSYLHHLENEMRDAALRVLDGVESFVDRAAARPDIVIGLGTGNLERGARLKLEPANLNRYFSFGGFGSDHEDRSEVLRTGHRRAIAQSKQEIPSGRVFVIGDTLLDVAAARRAGFKAVAVATGKSNRDELKTGNPDFLLSSLLEGDCLL